MKSFVLALCVAAALGIAHAAPLAPGLYSLKNVGYKTCNQESVYLGFNNKTCPIAPYSRPTSIGTNSVWKSWDITITGYHSSGFPLAYLSTGIPSGKTMRCPGNLSPLEPGTCGKSAVTIDQAKSEWRLVGPVSGYTNPTYKLVANMKKSGCARYLSASSSCEDSSLKMVTTGVSTRTLWELTALQLGTRAPGAASIVTVTRGAGAEKTVATLSFTAPVDPGCGPITSYDITAKPLSGSGATITKTVSGAATTTTLEGLTANVRYNFTIDADNACGEGPTTSYVETLATSDAVNAAGYYSACAVKADSKVKCWNSVYDNGYGEMDVPSKWMQGNDIVQMASNYYYTAAVTRNGTLGLWGTNTYNGCGNGEVDDENCLPEGFDEDVDNVYGWEYALCITKKNGDSTCIGNDYDDSDDTDYYKLPNFNRFPFTENTGAYDGYLTGVKVAKMGDDAGCVVYKDGRMRVTGYQYAADVTYADTPLPVTFYSGIVDCGVTGYEVGICSLKATGDLACSQYEDPSSGYSYYVTLPIPEGWDRNVASVDCAYYGCCAWRANGDFTCWGDTYSDGDSYNGYGLGTIPNWIAGINKYTWRTFTYDSKRRSLQSDQSSSIRWPVMTDVVYYSVGYYTTCVIRKDGSNQCWGYYSPSETVGSENFQFQLTIDGYDYLF
jgi:hypothetical protein